MSECKQCIDFHCIDETVKEVSMGHLDPVKIRYSLDRCDICHKLWDMVSVGSSILSYLPVKNKSKRSSKYGIVTTLPFPEHSRVKGLTQRWVESLPFEVEDGSVFCFSSQKSCFNPNVKDFKVRTLDSLENFIMCMDHEKIMHEYDLDPKKVFSMWPSTTFNNELNIQLTEQETLALHSYHYNRELNPYA